MSPIALAIAVASVSAAGTAIGAVTFQAPPSFLSDVTSPDSDFTVSSSIFEASSPANTFSDGGVSLGFLARRNRYTRQDR
jgi:hypothetical protein